MQNGSEYYSLRPYFTQIVYKVVDFSEDTINVKLGKNHLVSTLLKELMPNLLIVPCSCVSAHLCGSYACKRLTKAIAGIRFT